MAGSKRVKGAKANKINSLFIFMLIFGILLILLAFILKLLYKMNNIVYFSNILGLVIIYIGLIGWLGINKNLSLSWNYIKESRRYIYFAVFLFLLLILIGYFKPVYFTDYIKSFIEQILKQTEGLNTFQLIIFILRNNIQNAFLGFILGIALGIFPLFNLLLNGYVIGYVSSFAVMEKGYSSLLRLFPHGLFELPALILSLSLGLKLGLFFLGKNKKQEFMRRLEQGLRVFVFIIIPLLIIAGIIEGIFIGLAG